MFVVAVVIVVVVAVVVVAASAAVVAIVAAIAATTLTSGKKIKSNDSSSNSNNNITIATNSKSNSISFAPAATKKAASLILQATSIAKQLKNIHSPIKEPSCSRADATASAVCSARVFPLCMIEISRGSGVLRILCCSKCQC